MAFVQLSLIMGLRNHTLGTDSTGYLNIYNAVSAGNDTSLSLKAPLYVLIMKVINFISQNLDQAYFVFTAIAINFMILYAIKLAGVPCRRAIFLYICVFYLTSFNGMRTYFAIAMVFLSYALMRKRKYAVSIILGISAIFVHSTALIGLVILGIGFLNLTTKKGRRLSIIIVLLSAILYRFSFGIFLNLFPVYEDTLETVKDTIGASAVVFQMGVIIIFLEALYLMLKKKITVNDTNYNDFFNLFLLLLVEIVLYILGGTTWYMQRIVQYLEIYIILLFPLCDIYQNKYRQVFRVSVYLTALFLFCYRIFGNLGDISPYLFFWQG